MLNDESKSLQIQLVEIIKEELQEETVRKIMSEKSPDDDDCKLFLCFGLDTIST